MLSIASDKLGHFRVGLAIVAIGGLVHLPAALALCVCAAAGKEIWDLMGHGTPEWADFFYTLAGGAVGAGLILLI
jgi:hypothetical protein